MSQPNASLHGVDLKLKRAKKHLNDLDGVWRGFLETNPYELVPEHDAETGKEIDVVRRADPLPLCLSTIAGDVVHNLRSALDQLVPALILAHGYIPNYRQTEFPIGKCKSHYESIKPRKTDGISEAASDFMDKLKPYKGGAATFWAIHHLDVVDKHRLLLTVAASSGVLGVGDHFSAADRDDLSTFQKVVATPDDPVAYIPGELQILQVGATFEHYKEFKPLPLIALDEPELGERKALLPLLGELIEHTALLVAGFAECGDWGRATDEDIDVIIPRR